MHVTREGIDCVTLDDGKNIDESKSDITILHNTNLLWCNVHKLKIL